MKKTIFALMGIILLVISSNFVIIVGTGDYIDGENVSLQTSPPVIPQTSTETVRMDQLYIFEFSAEKGDSIHYRVSVDEGSAVGVYLIPLEDLSDLKEGESFRVFSDGTNEETRDFRVSVDIPEDGEFAVVIRPVDLSSSTVDVIIGSGIFSSFIVTLGGYSLFALLVAAIILIPIGIQMYRKGNKEQQKKEYAQPSQPPPSQNQHKPAPENEQSQSRPPPFYEKQNQEFEDQKQKQQLEQMEKKQNWEEDERHQGYQQQSTQQPPSDQKTQKEKLEELRDLKEDGLITEEDFERKKKQILDDF